MIIRVIEPVNCVLQKSAKSKSFVVHVDKVKRCYGNTPVSWIKLPPECGDSIHTFRSEDAIPDHIVADDAHEDSPTMSSVPRDSIPSSSTASNVNAGNEDSGDMQSSGNIRDMNENRNNTNKHNDHHDNNTSNRTNDYTSKRTHRILTRFAHFAM